MEPDALESIYLSYYRELYLYARSLCGDCATADDLVSETFLKALLSAELSGDSMKFWLFRVCKNLWLDELRKQKRHPSFALHEQESSSEESALQQILKTEQNQRLYGAILTLPQPYREIVVLHYFGQTPLNKVAELYGISPGNARTLLYRARIKLRNILKEGGE
ncbi:RNA polymerase sigma factor [Candidatus Soleaferrea massiliensis]|uniref:RNA polymerase sigma factor n=1 Tax=Candidatus Soleaferrea massiliensis TaxID=1470354 RepID=UPI00058C7490|nr:sigma-70 family RNA polymerase sigma factor [Candidatus Soleaferrea massiliensis]